MKVVISVQAKRGSSRGLVHYIAHSKIDEAREAADGSRQIFNEHSDDLTVQKANVFLRADEQKSRPANDDLLHLVISIRQTDFERLGTTESERQKSLQKITRSAVKSLEREIGADKLAWAAGVHRNTDNPHVHLAIQKTYFDRNLEKQTLTKIPAKLLPHYERDGNGDKSLVAGVLIDAASAKLDEIIREKTKQHDAPQHAPDQQQERVEVSQNSAAEQSQGKAKNNPEIERERDILARALLLKFYLEKAAENLESLEEGGHLRRFKIFDAVMGRERKMSLVDLERRAAKYASREIGKSKIQDAAQRDGLKEQKIKLEMSENANSIKRINGILFELIGNANKRLSGCENDFQSVRPEFERVKQKYRRENKKLPAPNLTRDELEMLQARSVEKKDLRSAKYLENVRRELARERGEPTRTSGDIERLKTWKILSALRVKNYEKQIKDAEADKRRSQIETGGKKWSLTKIESLIEREEANGRKITGKINNLLIQTGLIAQKKAGENLIELKTIVGDKLNEKAANLKADLNLEEKTLKTLREFYSKEENPEKDRLKPQFTAAQLAQVESLAFELKLAEVYRQNWQDQKEFLEQTGAQASLVPDAAKIAKEKQKILTGRAIAREIMCDIETARARDELLLFQKHKNFQKFEITDGKTGAGKLVSLKEVEFDARGSILDQTLEFFTENSEKRETRRTLEKVVKEKEIELKGNFKAAEALGKVAAGEAAQYKIVSLFGAAKYSHSPIFTAKELLEIELRIAESKNKQEANKLQNFLESADHQAVKNLAQILSVFNEKNERVPNTKAEALAQEKNSNSIAVENQTEIQTAAKNVQRENSFDEQRNRAKEIPPPERGR